MLWVDREWGPNSKLAHYYHKTGNIIAKWHAYHHRRRIKKKQNSMHAIIIEEELKK